MPKVTGYEYQQKELTVTLDDGLTRTFYGVKSNSYNAFNLAFSGQAKDAEGKAIPAVSDSQILFADLPTH